MRQLLVALWAFVAALSLACVQPARAHGALQRVQGGCVLKIGPDLMYFSGYQPRASHRKFCEDIPAAGDTLFVLDYAQTEMREMSADFRIIRDTGGDADDAGLAANTLAYLPPRVYPHGTLSFEYNFAQTGNFVAIVTLDGPHGEKWASRFPFSVGQPNRVPAPYYLLAAAAALALVVLILGKEDGAVKAR